MHRFDRPRQALAIALTALAGFVDATGFLAADGYFVSFMSGNTTRLGVDLVRQPAVAVVPALLIAGFVAGVALGALVAKGAGDRRKTAVLTLVAVLLANAALAALRGHTPAQLGALVLAMGAINNSFRRNGEVAVGLTYMTGALVRVGQSLAERLSGDPGAKGRGWASAALWLGLAGGATLGAAAWTVMPGVTLWLAAALAGLLAAFANRLGAAEG